MLLLANVLFQKISIPPPTHTHTHTHTHTEGNGNSEGPGIQKEAISWGGGGGASREFFPGPSSKIDDFLKTNSCSVEQAISYLTVNSLLKQ